MKLVKPKFEVGKWYKVESGTAELFNEKAGWYIKYSYTNNNEIHCSNYIYDVKFRNSGWFNKDYKFTLIDTEEIQQYLPDYHPNKIIKEPEFVLPAKWCVKVLGGSDVNPIVHKWRNSYWTGTGYINNERYWFEKIYDNTIEITFEQFKKYVLKESTEQQTNEKQVLDPIYGVKVGYTFNEIKEALTKEYDKEDVEEILKIIKTIN